MCGTLDNIQNMYKRWDNPTDISEIDLVQHFLRSLASSDVAHTLGSEEPRDVDGDVQKLAVNLFKEYIRSLKDFSSLLKVKQNAETKDSSTSPMQSPTRTPVLSDHSMREFQQLSTSARQCRFDLTPVLDNDELRSNTHAVVKGRYNNGFAGAFLKLQSEVSDSDSALRAGLHGDSKCKCSQYQTDSTGLLKPSSTSEAETKSRSGSGSVINSTLIGIRTNRYGCARAPERRNSLLMTQSDYCVNSGSRSYSAVLNPVLEKIKSEAAFHRPYTQMLWPTDEAVSPSLSNKEVRMKSWLQLRTVPTYEASPDSLSKKDLQPYTKKILTTTMGASEEMDTHQEVDPDRSEIALKQQTEAGIRILARDHLMVSLSSAINGRGGRSWQMQKPPSSSSSELSTQSMSSFKIKHGGGMDKTTRSIDIPFNGSKQRNYVTRSFASMAPCGEPNRPVLSENLCASSSTKERSGAMTNFDTHLSLEVPRIERRQISSGPEPTLKASGPRKNVSVETECTLRELASGSTTEKRSNCFGISHMTDRSKIYNKDAQSHSRHSMFTPSTPTNGRLQPQEPSLDELSSLPVLSGSIVKRNRPVQTRMLQRPLSLHVETANVAQSSYCTQPQPETPKLDSSTQTDEILSPDVAGARMWPLLEPDENGISTPLQPTHHVMENWHKRSEPIETWPLSIQSIVKPVDLPQQLSPETFHSRATSVNPDETDAHPLISPSQPVTNEAVSVQKTPAEDRTGASTELVRRLSPAAMYKTSSSLIRSPFNRGSSFMRRTRSPSGAQKRDVSTSEPVRCRSVHFSTDVLVAHTGLGPAPLLLSSAPLKEPASPTECPSISTDPDRTVSQKANRSNSVSMLISTSTTQSNLNEHRAYVPTIASPVQTSFSSGIKGDHL